MTEYIAKGKAKEAVDYAIELSKSEYDMMCAAINQIPAADVAPVVNGKWILDAKNHCHCSRCLYGRNIETQIGWNYCPNCGARCDI